MSDPEAFALTQSYPPFCTGNRAMRLPEISQALCAVHPDAPDWDHPYPDRSCEAAEYVLDPQGWRHAQTWADWQRTRTSQIIHMADHAIGGQCIPWRCSHAASPAQAALTLEQLDPVAARYRFSVRELAGTGCSRSPPPMTRTSCSRRFGQSGRTGALLRQRLGHTCDLRRCR